MKVSPLLLLLCTSALALPTAEELEPYKVIWEREVFKPSDAWIAPGQGAGSPADSAVDRAEIEGRRLTGVVQLGDGTGALLKGAAEGSEKLYLVGEALDGLPEAKVLEVGFGSGKEPSWVIVGYRGERIRLTMVQEPDGGSPAGEPRSRSRPGRPN